MTKQEIKDLVAAKIAGQGSQVDIGGALADILSGIVDAIPEGGGGSGLVIEGTADMQMFTPNEGQPSATEVIAAIESGMPVYIKDYTDPIEPTLHTFINYSYSTQMMAFDGGIIWQM